MEQRKALKQAFSIEKMRWNEFISILKQEIILPRPKAEIGIQPQEPFV